MEANNFDKGHESRINGVKRIHNLLIIDESGSMSAIYRSTIYGINETLQTIRKSMEENANQEHYVTLVTFNGGYYSPIYDHVLAKYAIDIKPNQYNPSGMTPLYDAMGRALTELSKIVAPEDVVLVTIITDGYENASHEFSGHTIKMLIDRLKSEGWVFTYIGANQDVELVASSLSIDNRMAFDADEDNTREMFNCELASRKAFYCRVGASESREDLKKDYFR
jgi:uncharacterized protein YegL